MSNGMGNDRQQGGYENVWNLGNDWSHGDADALLWNPLTVQTDNSRDFTNPAVYHHQILEPPLAVQRQSAQTAYAPRGQHHPTPAPPPVNADYHTISYSAASNSFLSHAPTLQPPVLYDDPNSVHQANGSQSQRPPVAIHQDNWLDRITAGERDEDQFGYIPFFEDGDDLLSVLERSQYGERPRNPIASEPLASLGRSDFGQSDPNMPPNTRRRSQNTIVDLTGESTTPPSPPPSRYSDNRKRPAEASSSAGPATKRRRSSVDGIEEVDLTADGLSAEEKLRQAQQQEAIRSQQAAEEARGPQRIGSRSCIICMENITDATTTSCGHFYCHQCLTQALMAGERNSERNVGNCPVCRKPISRKKLHHVIPISFMKKETYDQIRGKRN